MKRWRLVLALGLAAVLVAGCVSSARKRPSTINPKVHVVRRGETLWRISQRYGTTVNAIQRANNISDPTTLRTGQRLRIPSRTRVAASTKSGRWNTANPKGHSPKAQLAWPLPGRVSSGVGMRGGAHHDGIDLPAPSGTPIRAAESGRVVHSGSQLAGYGNMIIIKHKGNLSTVYAHNRANLVMVGEFVKKGQVIAEVGRTGRTTAPHLHFEVREDGRARNPLNYLP